MADWILVPCLVTLRNEFNAIAPDRDKTSDGSIGDAKHRKTISDHNPDESGNVPTRDSDKIDEVHGLDVDKNLNTPGLTMEKVIQYILSECRKPGTSGKDRGRLKYIIYNKRIWKASDNWKARDYHGSNPHDKHAHFSAEYDTKFEYDTRPWGLIEEFGDDLPVEQEKFNALFETALYQITLPDYALLSHSGQKRELTLAAFMGWADGRADVARVEKKVNELATNMDKMKEYLLAQGKVLQEINTKLSTSQTRGAVNL